MQRIPPIDRPEINHVKLSAREEYNLYRMHIAPFMSYIEAHRIDWIFTEIMQQAWDKLLTNMFDAMAHPTINMEALFLTFPTPEVTEKFKNAINQYLAEALICLSHKSIENGLIKRSPEMAFPTEAFLAAVNPYFYILTYRSTSG